MIRLKDKYLHAIKDIEEIAKIHNVRVDVVVEQIAIGEMVEREHTKNQNMAVQIAIDHLKESITYYHDLAEMEQMKRQEKFNELKNMKDFPTVHYCKHIQAGVAQYVDEMVLIETETLKQMSPSMVGVPVVIDHQKINLETLQQDADGYIVESFYNPLDGWFWAKFIIITDKGKEAISNGFSVSNAYIPTDDNKTGGTWHNVNYDREILDAEYTHLAIVETPRYEGACIMTCDEFKKYNANLESELKELKNSKTGNTKKTGGLRIMKFFTTKKEEIKVDDNVSIELSNGKEVSISEMINALEKEQPKENSIDETMKVNVCGKDMTLKDLKNSYEDLMNKKNESDAEAKKKEEEETKKNEADAEAKKKADEEAEAKKKEEEEKKNSSNFDTLQNSINKPGEDENGLNYQTREDKIKTGLENY